MSTRSKSKRAIVISSDEEEEKPVFKTPKKTRRPSKKAVVPIIQEINLIDDIAEFGEDAPPPKVIIMLTMCLV